MRSVALLIRNQQALSLLIRNIKPLSARLPVANTVISLRCLMNITRILARNTLCFIGSPEAITVKLMERERQKLFTMQYAFEYPELFGAYSSQAVGYIDYNFFKEGYSFVVSRMYGDDPEYFKLHDPIALVQKMSMPSKFTLRAKAYRRRSIKPINQRF